MDLFEDLFADDDILSQSVYDNGTDGSSPSLSSLSNLDNDPASLSPDSGHGSPLSSDTSSSNSPVSFLPWDSNQRDDFWTSILEDLPEDIGNDSDNNDYSAVPSPIFNDSFLNSEPLPQKNAATDEDVLSLLEHDYTETNFLQKKSINNITIDHDWDMDSAILNPATAVSMNDVSNISTIPVKTTLPAAKVASSQPVRITQSSQMSPVILKPITVIQKAGNPGTLQPHIKIGNKIFAIIQKGINQGGIQSLKVTQTAEIQQTSVTNALPDIIKVEDHDYAEEEEYTSLGTTGVSKGLGPNLVLTDEEKKLLEYESLTIPEGVATLTKEEEKVLKKVRRKIKNKQSAMESRRRRKEYIGNLERRVKHCTDLNQNMKKKVDKLSSDNKSLLTQLKQLQEVVATAVQGNRTSQTGTCLAVVLLSFAFFALPFNPIKFGNDQSNNMPTGAPSAAMFRSRQLLGHREDHMEHDYHDNESNSFNSINDSKTYSDEMKAHIERLLASEGSMLQAKLDAYIQEKLADSSNVALKEKQGDINVNNRVNVVEISENDIRTSKGRPYSDEI